MLANLTSAFDRLTLVFTAALPIAAYVFIAPVI
jgi:hypothetical protein